MRRRGEALAAYSHAAPTGRDGHRDEEMDGITATREIKGVDGERGSSSSPATTGRLREAAWRAGACGYVLKRTSRTAPTTVEKGMMKRHEDRGGSGRHGQGRGKG